jgi:hypothetical protein
MTRTGLVSETTVLNLKLTSLIAQEDVLKKKKKKKKKK